MPIRAFRFYPLIFSLVLTACAETRQLAVDYPGAETANSNSGVATKSRAFEALPGFQAIDGDDYYVRLLSEFNFKGDNVLKKGCESYAPSYKKTDLSAALIFNIRNSRLKFNNEVAGFSYQATAGNCNFKFDAKKQGLTPWLRLDHARDTQVDYSFYSSANSDVDVAGLVNKITAASTLLALTGVGTGVAVLGQVAGQWFNVNQRNQPKPAPATSANLSAETHTMPATVGYTDKTGVLNETIFKVYSVAEGGLNILKSNTQPLGELRIYPEITASLLLKTNPNGTPDARDLSLGEIGDSPIKSPAGDITLRKLVEQSPHPEKPSFKPDWKNYDEVESNCRRLKLVMKDLGFNKFDRNAFIYYFLANSADWKNYNISARKAQNDDISAKVLQQYHNRNFGNCLIAEDYAVMKSMGLPVNTEQDWTQMDDSSQKKEQIYSPLKSIERQLLAVLKNSNKTEMETQLYPLLFTDKQGDGTVLLQNHLGDFGLEKLIQPISSAGTPVTGAVVPPLLAKPAQPAAIAPAIPNQGTVINARQLVQVISGLAFDEMTCARAVPDLAGKPVNAGIILFTTKAGSPRAKGGAMEFEFLNGKINRLVFQSPAYRDFEQSVIDRSEMGGCRIEPEFLKKLH